MTSQRRDPFTARPTPGINVKKATRKIALRSLGYNGEDYESQAD